MRPQTGEILAMANRPNFDLNLRAEGEAGADEESRHHRHDGAGLDFQDRDGGRRLERTQGPARHDDFLRERRLELSADAPCTITKRYGDLSVQDILVKSSNIGAAKLAISVGEQKFYEYIRRFGFGDRTGIELPGEIRGMIRPPQTWSKISITRIPMGHEVGVTPLQMTVAMATIANGGKLDHAAHREIDHDGRRQDGRALFRRWFCGR